MAAPIVIRRLLVLLVVLSMTMAGALPATASATAAHCAAQHSSSAACCCDNGGQVQCGMACCRPAPRQETPAPQRAGNADERPVLSVPLAGTAASERPHSSPSPVAAAQWQYAATLLASLQAQHVRLQP